MDDQRRPVHRTVALRALHITRFGAYVTAELALVPAAFNPVLAKVDFSAMDLAT